MLFIITGNGKGKTTSAMGMITRALGHGLRCAVIQFIKSKPETSGEYQTMVKLGVLWENYGAGFIWEQKNLQQTEQLCLQGWERAKVLCSSGDYDLVVLDEFTYAVNLNFPSVVSVSDFFKSSKKCNIVITGRDAPQELIDIADNVSEIREIKHHYYKDHSSICGIEF